MCHVRQQVAELLVSPLAPSVGEPRHARDRKGQVWPGAPRRVQEAAKDRPHLCGARCCHVYLRRWAALPHGSAAAVRLPILRQVVQHIQQVVSLVHLRHVQVRFLNADFVDDAKEFLHVLGISALEVDSHNSPHQRLILLLSVHVAIVDVRSHDDRLLFCARDPLQLLEVRLLNVASELGRGWPVEQHVSATPHLGVDVLLVRHGPLQDHTRLFRHPVDLQRRLLGDRLMLNHAMNV